MTGKQPIFLRIMKGGQLVAVKQFTADQIVIGREGQVDLAIADAGISAIHCMVEDRGGGKFFVCDLGSESGTFFQNQKVIDAPLTSGASFRIGDTTIEFHIGVPKAKAAAEVYPEPKKPVAKTTPAATPVKPAPSASAKASMSSPSGVGSGMMAIQPNAKRADKGTYAPSSKVATRAVLSPGRGPTVEVMILWKDRLLNSYLFTKRGPVSVGAHPKNDIILPIFGSIRVSHPLLNIGANAFVYVTADMTGELVREASHMGFEDLKRSGLMKSSGVGFAYEIKQGELMRIEIGEGVQIVVRYAPQPPKTMFAPWLDLTANQWTGLIVGMLGMILFLFYVFLYSPEVIEKPEDEPPRKAQFIYKRRVVEELKPAEVAPVSKVGQTTIKDKDMAPSRGEEGKASAAKPNKTTKPEKIPTTAKPGKDKGIQPLDSGKKDGGAPKAAPQKDVTKSGLLSVFGTKGTQEQLNKAIAGTGQAGAASAKAKGEGAEAAGSGVTLGGGTRELGQGGNGTATVGIAGVNTKGRGGGVTGYGTGLLGAKKNATILAGGDEAVFTGTIDREAIRRVVMAHVKEIKACYERGLNKDPGLYGKISIQWTIGAAGRVLEAGIKTTTLNNTEVENCAVSRLKTWKFPEPPVNEQAVVSFPFVFQAQE